MPMLTQTMKPPPLRPRTEPLPPGRLSRRQRIEPPPNGEGEHRRWKARAGRLLGRGQAERLQPRLVIHPRHRRAQAAGDRTMSLIWSEEFRPRESRVCRSTLSGGMGAPQCVAASAGRHRQPLRVAAAGPFLVRPERHRHRQRQNDHRADAEQLSANRLLRDLRRHHHEADGVSGTDHSRRPRSGRCAPPLTIESMTWATGGVRSQW